MAEGALQAFIDNGGRLERPPNCAQEIVDMLYACWNSNSKLRPVSGKVCSCMLKLIIAEFHIAVSVDDVCATRV